MARAWSISESEKAHKELYELYIIQNKTIGEIADLLGIAYQTVYQRMQKVHIKTSPQLKSRYRNQRSDIKIPEGFSKELAEFVGIMLGDGHISHFQIVISLGSKEQKYSEHVRDLVNKIFHVDSKISIRSTGYRDVYIGSVVLTKYLMDMGLVRHKTHSQVQVPHWIMKDKDFMRACIRGFFDTDGSVYKLRYGSQISLTNSSLPLLKSLQSMLLRLEYKPSSISSNKVYLTRRPDLIRFFKEVKPHHPLKRSKLEKAISSRVGTQVVNEGRL